MRTPAQTNKVRRFIHRAYWRSGSLNFYVSKRVRPAGVAVMSLAPLAFILMPRISQTPVFQLRGMILGALACSFAWSLTRRCKISAKRILPAAASAGEPLIYYVEITNLSKHKVRQVLINETEHDDRPTLDQFSLGREPGEESRNAFDQYFAYYRWLWLRRKNQKYTPAANHQKIQLAGHETKKFPLSITPLKRGVIQLDKIDLCLPDPLGLFQKCRRIKTEPQKVIILPKRYRIPALKLPGSARYQLGGESASFNSGESGDFTSVRDYRPGDPPRHIHWKSWAKTGKAIVKEYEEIFFPHYGLILDTCAPPNLLDSFEEAVSVAASFAVSLDSNQSLLDLMFIKDQAHRFTTGRNEAKVDHILEILAEVEPQAIIDYQVMEKLLHKHLADLSSCIVVFVGWDQQKADFLRNLHQANANLLVMAIFPDQQQAQQQLASVPAATSIHPVLADETEKSLANIFS
ncbi:DUF58 domain-containing protein [Persicirhabdus sediminis]|uniref:DUF58 domain-containing protein n=1 Tax=Persicirhabdus sediminis TaxID=454144 RepID=A0A8J7ME02_9BACT|nr:DUF58 domain-containing protein [Persicirhabdus sediminis]MBK1790966.1 DUF58 domain-containing protein [Persicirhabdus sediminis]